MLEGDKITIPGHRCIVADPSSFGSGAAQLLERILVDTLTHWFDLQIVKSSSMPDGYADLYLLLGDQFGGLVGPQGTSGAPSYPKQLTDLVIKKKIIVLSTAEPAARNANSEFWNSTQFVQQP